MNRFLYLVDYLLILTWSLLVFAVWNYMRPFELWEPFIVSVVFFVVTIIQTPPFKFKLIAIDKLKFFTDSSSELEEEIEFTKNFWRGVFFERASGLVIPSILACIFLYLEPIRQEHLFARIKSIFQQFSGTAELFVTSEGPDHKEIKYELNRNSLTQIQLKSQSLVRINVAAFTQISPPTILIKPKNSAHPTLSFNMTSVQKNGASDHDTQLEAMFSVTETSEFWIPSIAAKSPLAVLTVTDDAQIQISLSTEVDVQKPQLDTNLIPLLIKTSSEFPIDLIELKIKVGDQIFKQKIIDVLNISKLNIVTRYQFSPEPYMTEDEGDLAIQAQVWNKKQPTPQTGLSEPIIIKIQSAYGRYLAVLQELSEARQLMTEAIGENTKGNDITAKIEQKLSGSIALSAESVFFDPMDRMELEQLLQRWTEQKDLPQQTIFEIKDDLSRFLAEHEALNDQERDLDFFVASKQISGHLNSMQWKNNIKNVTRLQSFVEERGKRWTIRVERLPREFGLKPELMKLKVHEILKNLNSLTHFTDDPADLQQFEEAKEKLNIASNIYRTWIDQLAKAEEEFKKKMEKEKNKALAQGRDEIKILRKNQAEISTRLDHKDSSQIKITPKTWPTIRMLQAKNKEKSMQVAKKMENFSALASRRLHGASEQMALTIQQGDGKNELEAENASDAAARLLIFADQAAAEDQGRSKRERGRRKRITGNNYFGQAISGGDVDFTRNYQVDKKFREDILEHIDASGLDETERKILDDYVRDVVR